jgi:hypothetical protein
MRKFLISLAFLLVAPSVYSQDTARSHPLTKQDYMQKSKNQKTGAFVLLIGGISTRRWWSYFGSIKLAK